MSYPNYRSTMGSDERDRMLRAQEKPMKTSSIVSTDQAIYCNSEVDRMLRKEKNSMLKQSLEEKIRNLKMACERVKKISGNSKTPANQQDEAKTCAAEKEDIQIRYNFLKPQKERSTQSSDCSSTKESIETKTSSSQKELKGLNQLTLPTQHLNSLKEVREIDSFVLDEDEELQQEMSFVQEHGTAVLNWGVCIGRATEFKVLNYIDEGIYGKVYLAQSHRNSAIYSIKSIYRSKMDNNQILQLIREVKIQSFLNHPHIVRLYHFFVDEDCAYLVLQPCLGKNLYHNMKEVGRFPERTVREYVRQICLGVEYMHKNDVLHRDLKPENILLHQNMIKICDFGWAVHSPLMRGTQCGTPLYTSPEIVSKVPYDSKIDIWSIGILTYEMLYGTIPFEIRNPRDMTKIIEQDVYFPKDSSVSDTAKKFMSACLRKNPNDRPTARQLLEHQFMFKEQMFRMTIS